MTQVTINGIKRGELNAETVYHYVQQIKHTCRIILWSDDALVIETGA